MTDALRTLLRLEQATALRVRCFRPGSAEHADALALHLHIVERRREVHDEISRCLPPLAEIGRVVEIDPRDSYLVDFDAILVGDLEFGVP
jgi:hypothetical protein